MAFPCRTRVGLARTEYNRKKVQPEQRTSMTGMWISRFQIAKGGMTPPWTFLMTSYGIKQYVWAYFSTCIHYFFVRILGVQLAFSKFCFSPACFRFPFSLQLLLNMQAVLVASALFGLVALTLGAVSPDGRRTLGAVADVDPNTNVPRDWEAYKKFCKVTTDRSKDAAQKATFLKNVEKVRANQAQQASGRKLAPNFIGMNLNCNSHMTPEEFKKGAFGLLPSPSRDLPTRNRRAVM